MNLNFTRQKLPLYISAGLLVLLIAFGLSTSLFAQSGSYGNTYIPNGAETVVFGGHSFQNGGAGTLPGIIFTERTGPQGYFSFGAGATTTGAADNAHVNGYVRKYGATAFTFPIGQGTVYRPLAIPLQSASTVLGAAYFFTDPTSATLPMGASFPRTNLGAGVSGVSPIEYWDLDGTLATIVTLTWNAASNLNTLTGGSASRLIIVGYNPSISKWENLGQGALTGTVSTTGTITSAVSFVPNTYSVLTFGSMAMVTANSDAGTASSGTGGIAVANVTTNDVINGTPATLGTGGNATLASVGTYPAGITLNTTTGSVSVATGTVPGTYTLAYQLCDKLTTPTCATTAATITVTPSVTAVADAGSAGAAGGGIAVPNVAANDVVNGQPATTGTGGNAAVAAVGTYPAGITLDPATGSVRVAQGTAPGTYTISYQLCDRLTMPTCTTGSITVSVLAGSTATPDAGTVSTGTGGTAVANVVANDLVNGQPATLVAGGNATLATLGIYPAGITLDPSTGSVSVAVGTLPGSYTIAYQLCDKLDTPTCATTTAIITVTPSVTAGPDAGTVSTGTGGTAVANVVVNDVVNSQPAVLGNGGNAIIASLGTYPAGIILNPATGVVSVALGTLPGSYTIAYQLCDKLATPTCTTGLVAITVTPSVTAAADAGSASAGTGGIAVANVVANDVINTLPATLGAAANATIASVGTYPAGITLDPTTGSVSVAAGTLPGSYTVAYQLCDNLATPTCATTTVTITVIPSLTAGPDSGTVSAGIGGTAVANVAANDVVNGQPATTGTGGNAAVAAVGTYPAGITLNTATGSVSVAAGTLPGSYTVAYQLCDNLATPTCATTTVTITVIPSLTAGPDSGTVSAGIGGTAVANVAANDVVNGQPATTGTGGNAAVAAVGTYPAGITLNTATGSVGVAVGTTPGTYTISYQLCDKLTIPTCTMGSVAITVTPALVGNPDTGAAPAGGGMAILNVAANDLVNGQPATLGVGGNAILTAVGNTPGITVDPATGGVNVAAGTVPGSYTVTYQLCDRLTPATCTTGVATITVTPSVTASPDAGTVSSGTGGTAVANVAANDIVNGQSATLGLGGNATVASLGTYPAGITLNTTTGSVSVAVGTAPGSYTLAYQLCDRLTTPTCTTTTATITVTPSVTASPDAGTVSAGTGGITVANVAANDLVNGVPATLGAGGNATVASLGTYPAGITLNTTTGSVSVAVGTMPGRYTVTYQLCDNLTTPTCTTGVAAITVTPSLTASPDAGTAPASGGTIVPNVAANDIVNGQPAILGPGGNATVAAVGTYPAGITLNTATGSVSVAVGTTPGSYTIAYQLCDRLTTPTCITGLLTLTITPSVVATADAGAEGAASGGVAVPNIVANDLINGLPATLGTGGNAVVAAIGTYPAGISLDPATGSVSVAIGTTPGTYTLAYQLCDRLTTPTCATTTVMVMVLSGSTASPDNGTVSTGTGGVAIQNVAANDVVNGQSVSLGTGGNALVVSIGTYPAGITLNTTTGSVSVAIGTAPGTYTLAYQLCDKLTIPTCTTGVATVTVTPSVLTTPDAGTVSSGAGGTAVVNVAANDVVNGIPATLGQTGNSVIASVGVSPAGITLDPNTGSVRVAIGTIPGDYLVAYQLCDRLSSPTCTTGLATITVTPSLTASPDAGMAPAGGGVAVPNVTANDIVNGQPATLGMGGNATVAAVGTYPAGVTLEPATGTLNVAVGTTPGSYTVGYQLCDRITPITCTTGLLTITVTPSVTASPDAGTVSAGTGGITVANVTANDIVNGVPATLGTTGNAVITRIGTYPTGITLALATGRVNVAVGTTPDTYVLAYQVCDRLTTPTCATTTITITVTPSLTATPDSGTVTAATGGTALANVAANDVVNGQPATLGTAGNATLAALGTYPPGVTLDPNSGALTVAPNATPGSFTLAYQLCDKLTPTTCTTATLTLSITTSLTARPDAATVVGGASVSIAILANDSNPTGSPVTNLTQVTLPLLTSAPAQGTATVNPDGSVSYSANIAGSGTDSFTYQLCDRANPGQCSSATVTLTLLPNRTVVLSPKVYLQGALFGVGAGNPLMRDDLRAKGLLPLTSPYPMLGLSGLTPVGSVSSGVLSTTGTDAVVDWVYVELRSGTDPTLVVDSRSALVQRDGDIVEVDGVSALRFSVAQSGSFYVGVRHRNHLSVLTAQAVTLSFTATVVDFRTATTATYNRNANSLINQPQVVVSQGVALWAGNAIYDSGVIYQGPGSDVNVLSQEVINASGNVFVTPFYKLRGYYVGDVNLNGEVVFQGSGNDVDFIYQNIIKNHPGNALKQNNFTIREQLP